MGMVVPISEPRAVPSAIGLKPPSPVMLAIAAATMHQQGRLFEPTPTEPVDSGTK